MSAWPACWAVSLTIRMSRTPSVVSRRSCGQWATDAGDSRSRSAMTRSAWAQARRYKPMMYSLDSSGFAHMSAPCQIEPSAIQDMVSGAGRPRDSPRYAYSSPARCFTRPSRFVPVGVIGRRRSYSPRSSSLDSNTALPAWSLRCSSSFRSAMATGISPGTDNLGGGPPTEGAIIRRELAIDCQFDVSLENVISM